MSNIKHSKKCRAKEAVKVSYLYTGLDKEKSDSNKIGTTIS
jgi:hypothetical protein